MLPCVQGFTISLAQSRFADPEDRSPALYQSSGFGGRESLKPSCHPLVSLEYLCHVYVRNDSLAGVVIADSEYPSRVAFTLLEKVSV